MRILQNTMAFLARIPSIERGELGFRVHRLRSATCNPVRIRHQSVGLLALSFLTFCPFFVSLLFCFPLSIADSEHCAPCTNLHYRLRWPWTRETTNVSVLMTSSPLRAMVHGSPGWRTMAVVRISHPGCRIKQTVSPEVSPMSTCTQVLTRQRDGQWQPAQWASRRRP
jgi:hypothetical protein